MDKTALGGQYIAFHLYSLIIGTSVALSRLRLMWLVSGVSQSVLSLGLLVFAQHHQAQIKVCHAVWEPNPSSRVALLGCSSPYSLHLFWNSSALPVTLPSTTQLPSLIPLRR
jgi:hypothetical protein